MSAAGKEVFQMPEQYMYHGLAFPRGPYPPEHMDRAVRVPTREGDVVVMSYPRTGTTLSIQLVSLLQCRNETELEAVDKTLVYKRVCFLEMKHLSGDEIARFGALPGSRIIKTHLPPSLSTNWTENACVVATIRNPKDTLVSVFHFLQGIPEFGPFSGTWDDFFAWYQSGTMWNGDCLDWSLDIWNQRHRANLHIMFYEDLITSLDSETTKLAEFLRLSKTPEQIQTIVDRSKFSSMKSNKATNYEDSSYKPGFEFVRSGKIGEWKKYFTVAQNEWMDARIEEKLADSGLSFRFE